MKRLNRFKSENEDFQLNLNPMLDIFVGLIPVLLMTASLASFSALQTSLPGAADTKADANTPKEVRLSFEVRDGEILVAGYDSGFERPVGGINTKFSANDLKGLKDFLLSVQTKYQKLGPSLFYATGSTSYQKAIDVLDTVKTTISGGQIILAAGVIE